MYLQTELKAQHMKDSNFFNPLMLLNFMHINIKVNVQLMQLDYLNPYRLRYLLLPLCKHV